MSDVPSNPFAALATAGVQTLRPYEPGKPVSELQRELGLTDIIKLASNENPLGPSPFALAAMQRALNDSALYPDGAAFELRNALAKRHGVDISCITVGNGSNDVLDIIGRAFLDHRVEAVFSTHAFAVYPIVTAAVGATARVAVANSENDAQPFGHNLAAMADAVSSATRVVFIANPNNPTGTWLGGAALKSFIAALPRSVIVVVDEAYVEYVHGHSVDCPNAAEWVAEFPNLIVTRTFSKAYGLAALRVGYAISHPDVAEVLNRVRQPFNVNSLAQVAALAAFSDAEHLRRSVEVNISGLQVITNGLRERNLFFIPSIGNFIAFRVPRSHGATDVYQALLRAGVIVRPIENYQLPGFLRVSIGTVAQLNRFLHALDSVLARGNL